MSPTSVTRHALSTERGRRSPNSLTNLLLQGLKARQILFVTLVNLAGSFVRGGGFCAHQGLRAAAAVGDMREITAVAIDNLMQMLPTLLPHTETMHGLLGVS